jgi:hypothetical protein
MRIMNKTDYEIAIEKINQEWHFDSMQEWSNLYFDICAFEEATGIVSEYSPSQRYLQDTYAL